MSDGFDLEKWIWEVAGMRGPRIRWTRSASRSCREVVPLPGDDNFGLEK